MDIPNPKAGPPAIALLVLGGHPLDPEESLQQFAAFAFHDAAGDLEMMIHLREGVEVGAAARFVA